MTNALPPDQDRADIVILPPMLLALTLGLAAALDALLPLQVLAAPDWWSVQMIIGLVLTGAHGLACDVPGVVVAVDLGGLALVLRAQRAERG